MAMQTNDPADQRTIRADRRPEPRLSVALAASGCALAVLGVLIVAGDLLAGDPSSFDGSTSTNQIPGIILSALVMAAGYLLLVKFEGGPLGSAGVVASGLAAPPLMFFITFSEDSFPPFSTEAILGLSAILWLGSYAVGPGRGHSFYLGAGLIGIWLFVLEIVEGVFTFPFDALGGFAIGSDPGFNGGFGDDPFGPGPSVPSVETLGVLTLLFAVGYAITARRFDRDGKDGIATPFTFAALVTAPVSILFLSDTLGDVLTGVAFIGLGLAYGFGGSKGGRRFTTWLGGAYVAQGAVVIVTEVVGDSPSATTVGIVMVLFGAVIVLGGHLVSVQFGEPPETTPGPSTFTKPTPAAAVAPAGYPQQPPIPQPADPTPTVPDPTATLPPPPAAPQPPPPPPPANPEPPLPPPPGNGPPPGAF